MAVRRKVFRIEESAYHLARDPAPASVPAREAEFQALRAPVTVQTPISRDARERTRAQIAEAQACQHELGLIHAAVGSAMGAMAALGAQASDRQDDGRLRRELAAIVADAERSVEAILQAADGIDRSAAELSAGLAPGRERELADDIRCHVGQILEACGFHDLTGQRVANVQATLARIEAEIARLMDIWSGIELFKPLAIEAQADGDRRYLNGPKLNGDSGHCSQKDIDTVFVRT